MKRTLTLFAAILLLAAGAAAQKLSYQAVVRNDANELVAETTVQVSVTVLNASNAVQYAETHANVQTNRNGLLSLMIGEGTPTGSATLADVVWADASVRTVITLPNSTTITSVTPVNSVPYALYADNVSLNMVSEAIANYIANHDIGGEDNVQADWNVTDPNSDAYIQHKPTIPTVPTNVSAFNNDANYVTQTQLNAANYITATDVPTQVNADWNATSGAAEILNKPNLATVATTGNYNDLTDRPTIPTVPADVSAFNNDANYVTQTQLNAANYITAADVPAQVNADWNATSGTAEILNKPDLATVATTGSYNDLSDKPTIPTVPEDVSAFNNDANYVTQTQLNAANYITAADVPAQVNADWNATSGTAEILNKPDFATVATTGSYNDLSDKPTIPTVPTNVSAFNNDANYVTQTQLNAANYITAADVPAQVNADWEATSGAAEILNKPTIPAAANNATLTLQRNGADVGSFSADAATDNTVNILVPTQTSDLTNNSGFITEDQLSTLLSSMNNTIDSLKNVISNMSGGGNPVPPTVTTATISNIDSTSATSGGNVTSDGGAAVFARGICWSTSPNPTLDDNHTDEGFYTGEFTSYMTNLTANTLYYVRAYAINYMGTSYGENVVFFAVRTSIPVGDAQPCAESKTVTDYDGNIYNTVKIGNQCWMRENLRAEHYSNGTEIPLGNTTSASVAYRYYPNNNPGYVPIRGYLYNWKAVMRQSNSSENNPSGVQGICPTGWHVPSLAEWTQLINYVSGQSEYLCGYQSNTYIAKALASTTGVWTSAASVSSNTCVVQTRKYENNSTGFSAYPAGSYNYTAYGWRYNDPDEDANYWTTSRYNNTTARIISLSGNSGSVSSSGGFSHEYATSVRCLRN